MIESSVRIRHCTRRVHGHILIAAIRVRGIAWLAGGIGLARRTRLTEPGKAIGMEGGTGKCIPWEPQI